MGTGLGWQSGPNERAGGFGIMLLSRVHKCSCCGHTILCEDPFNCFYPEQYQMEGSVTHNGLHHTRKLPTISMLGLPPEWLEN